MNKKAINKFLANLVMWIMIIECHNPYLALAGDEEVNTDYVVDYNEQDNEEDKNISDGVRENNDNNIQNDEIEWQEPAENWYEDYIYRLKGEDLIIQRIKESVDISGNIVIPSTAVCKGKTYKVALLYDIVYQPVGEYAQTDFGLWCHYADLNKTITGIKICDGVRALSCDNLFSNLKNLSYLDIGGLDTSGVSSMKQMFAGCSKLEQLDVSKLDTTSVVQMNSMFANCYNLESLDVSTFDVSSVSDMGLMFSGCRSLLDLNLANWDTSSVTNMGGVFSECNGFETIELNEWDVSSVINMTGMFRGCDNLKTLDLSVWNTASVEDLDYMFEGCTELTSLNLNGWKTSNVTRIDKLFRDCINLKYLDLGGWDLFYPKDTGYTNMYDKYYLREIFNGDRKLETIITPNRIDEALGEMIYLYNEFINIKTGDKHLSLNSKCVNTTIMRRDVFINDYQKPHILFGIFGEDSVRFDKEKGYSYDTFSISVNVFMLIDDDELLEYNNATLSIDLPEGLSFSRDKDERTKIVNIGKIDNNNSIFQDKYDVYVCTDNYIPEFKICGSVRVDECINSRDYEYIVKIPTNIAPNIEIQLLPENKIHYDWDGKYKYFDCALKATAFNDEDLENNLIYNNVYIEIQLPDKLSFVQKNISQYKGSSIGSIGLAPNISARYEDKFRLYILSGDSYNCQFDIRIRVTADDYMYTDYITYPVIFCDEEDESEEDKSEEGFNLALDGYSFVNGYEGFNYNDNYRIPLERYQEVFGDSFTEHIYNQKVTGWCGNCFGMASTAVMFHKGILDLNDYREGNSPTNRAFGKTVTRDGESHYNYVEKESEIAKLIERYVIWQYSNEYFDSYCDDQVRYLGTTSAETFKRIIDILATSKEPIMLSVFWKDDEGKKVGHSLVIDSSREAVDLGNGWYRIYLYDPNNPYYNFGTLTPKFAYNSAQNRSISLNTITGEWNMTAMVNGNGNSDTIIGYDTYGNILRDSTIYFEDVKGLPKGFEQKGTYTALDDYTSISYRSNNFEIYDSQNKLIYHKVNGMAIQADTNIGYDFIYNDYIKENKSDVSEGVLRLAPGRYKAVLSEGNISFSQNRDYVGVVVSDNPVTITSTGSNSLEIVANTSASVNVVIMDASLNNAYTSLKTDLIMCNSEFSISLSNNILDINSKDESRFDVEIITEYGKKNINNVSSNDVNELNIQEYDDSITEYNSPLNPVPIITDETTELYLVKGQKFTLDGAGWQSSDKKSLSISKKGVLSAKKVNTKPIKLTKNDQTIDVYITQPKMVSKSILMEAGNSRLLTLENSENLPILWNSDSVDIATVSENGMINAIAKGTTTITAYVNGKTYKCKVKVKESIVAEERTLHMYANTSKKIRIAGLKNVVWDSQNEDIAWMKKNTLYVGEGGETILSTEYNGKKYIIRVIVEDPSMLNEKISSSGKNKYVITLKSGEHEDIYYKCINRLIAYKSTKGEVAYIDEKGTIWANKAGKAKLTATVDGKKIKLLVIVNE